MTDSGRVAGSFRDPSGFVFVRDGVLCRQVNRRHRIHYDFLMQSGLYAALIEAGLLVPHEEVDISPECPDVAFKVIRPERVAFVSHPYEWCFGQLQGAAMATLRIQKLAVEHGMSLRDASAYNIQFHRGRPMLIDTLSFEVYPVDRPWVAYRQFCQHFLAPLAVMAYRDVRLGVLLRDFIDGIPIDLASRLLPWRTRLRFSLLSHIHLHARSQRHYEGKQVDARTRPMSHRALVNLLDHLSGAVKALRWKPRGTEWGAYYDDTNYSDAALASKERIVEELVDSVQPKMVWDLGANVGVFSRVAGRGGATVVAFDVDPAAVEVHYRLCRRDGEESILPLLLDLTNPSPALGWAHRERQSLRDRGPADVVLALALVHHLAISNNVPLEEIAGFFAELASNLIIEFVPKDDSQVQRLLATREDVFDRYTRDGFETAFARFFNMERREAIPDSNRIVYLMRHRAER